MENVARTCALHMLKPVADAKSTGVEDKRISAHGFAPSSDQAMDERVSILNSHGLRFGCLEIRLLLLFICPVMRVCGAIYRKTGLSEDRSKPLN